MFWRKRLVVSAGKVSHIGSDASVLGDISKGSGFIYTLHKTKFRINNKPAVFVSFSGTLSLADGESITVVGYDGNEFSAVALKNNDTGVEYSMQDIGKLFIYGGAFVIFLGIVMALITFTLSWKLLGFIVFGLPGLLLVVLGYIARKIGKPLVDASILLKEYT